MIRCFAFSDLVAAARTGERRLLDEFDQVCAELGVFALTGVPLPDGLLERVHADTLAFFRLPTADKDALRSPDGNRYVGWDGPSDEGESRSALRKQMFHIGPRVAPTLPTPDADGEVLDGAAADAVAACSLWPAGLPGFVASWHEFYRHMQLTSWRIGEVMAAALELPLPQWRRLFVGNWADLAANYYPAGRPGDVGARNEAHRDITLFTVLYQDSGGGGGLRVQHRGGTWLDVPPTPDTFLVNVGELLQFVTGGRWWAVPHEVTAPRSADPAALTPRVSIPFFFRPDDALTVSPLLAAGDAVLIREWLDRRRPARATT